MLKPENVYISEKSSISLEYFKGDYKNDKAVYSFTLEVKDGIPELVTWENEIPENSQVVEELIKLKYRIR